MTYLLDRELQIVSKCWCIYSLAERKKEREKKKIIFFCLKNDDADAPW